jgi:hypothetical protein
LVPRAAAQVLPEAAQVLREAAQNWDLQRALPEREDPMASHSAYPHWETRKEWCSEAADP